MSGKISSAMLEALVTIQKSLLADTQIHSSAAGASNTIGALYRKGFISLDNGFVDLTEAGAKILAENTVTINLDVAPEPKNYGPNAEKNFTALRNANKEGTPAYNFWSRKLEALAI